MKILLKSFFLILTTGIIYTGLLVFPNPLFAHKYHSGNIKVFSDRPIPNEIENVIEQVRGLTKRSELYDEKRKYRFYICNNEKKFIFFARNKNAGGVVNFALSGNVFIRQSDIVNNKIIPPNGWMFETKERPLSYFMAHEMTHTMQMRVDRFMAVKNPVYIIEGYADYIGKAAAFDYDKYCEDYVNGAEFMNPASGLYNKYHLYVAYWMDKKGYSFKQLLKEKPDLEKTMERIKIERLNKTEIKKIR